MPKTKSLNKGLTLIELLVVIAVMGILAVFITSNISSSLVRARDSQRKNDFHQLQIALQLYYADNGSTYPSGSAVSNKSSWSTFRASLAPYMKTVPVDPINGGDSLSSNYSVYVYIVTIPPVISAYRLCAHLENGNDPQINYPNPAGNYCVYPLDNTTWSNYGVKSPQ